MSIRLSLVMALLVTPTMILSSCSSDSKDDTDGGTSDSGANPADLCPAAACNVMDESECSDGNACYVGLADNDDPIPVCGVAGTKTDLEACSRNQDCAPGLHCDRDDKVCRTYCCGGSSDACPSGQQCLISIINENTGDDTGVGLCRATDDCDPLADTGCPADRACTPIGGGEFLCLPPGSAEVGAACVSSSECVKGAACVEETGRCATFCDQEDDDPSCDSGQTCGNLAGYTSPLGACR